MGRVGRPPRSPSATAHRKDRFRPSLQGPDAEEAFVVALRQALGSARLNKVHWFGQVLGATLAEDAPDWQEAAEFIRSLEEFSDADFEALRILWKVQRTVYRGVDSPTGRPEMPTGGDHFTRTWNDVLDNAKKSGVSNDDWYSRCGRLGGFGLVLQVQTNSSYQSPEHTCYRLTGRAVRLLGLLGRKVDPKEYPKWLYKGPNKVEVADEDAESALGDGWTEMPGSRE